MSPDEPSYFPHKVDVPGVGCAAMIFEVFGSGDHMVCGLYWMIAKTNAPPRKWLRTMREEMRKIEQMAKESGVSEMRLGSKTKDWRRVLTDYEPFDCIPNGLRKRL